MTLVQVRHAVVAGRHGFAALGKEMAGISVDAASGATGGLPGDK